MGTEYSAEPADFESIARKQERYPDEFDVNESEDPFVLPGQLKLVSRSRTVIVKHKASGLIRTHAAARWLVQFEHDFKARVFS